MILSSENRHHLLLPLPTPHPSTKGLEFGSVVWNLDFGFCVKCTPPHKLLIYSFPKVGNSVCILTLFLIKEIVYVKYFGLVLFFKKEKSYSTILCVPTF